MPDAPVHCPKTNIKKTNKVIKYGEPYRAELHSEKKLYAFRHQTADLKVSEGIIPVDFMSTLFLEEGHPVYLQTRAGGWNEDSDKPRGPEYLVTWRSEMEEIPPSQGWQNNLDYLWSNVLTYFERKNLLSEDTLDYLDADPYVLFGIDDFVTQQALIKLQKFPALYCESVRPSLTEYAYYLRIPPGEKETQWLVEAFADTELPKPWTCYKGAGSIVCFIRADTGDVTWKHPFFDYFRQMRDFCRQATYPEIMQMRVTRMIWGYEASRIETEVCQEPLIAPQYILAFANIFGFDVKTEGCTVRNIKAQLKMFGKSYMKDQDIDIKDIISCHEILQADTVKHAEMKQEWGDGANDIFEFDLHGLANGEVTCCNCKAIALAFCLECKDYLCLECYDWLHQRGGRKLHSPFRLVGCALCDEMPAKLHCNFTDKHLCHGCYALKHIATLPPDGRENPPKRIEYKMQYIRYATYAKERQDIAKAKLLSQGADGEEPDEFDSVLSTDWHPFYDSRGVKFYHNFCTGERMRQCPEQVPNCADPSAAEDRNPANLQAGEWAKSKAKEPDANLTHSQRLALQPLSLNGYDSLTTGALKAPAQAAEEQENRSRSLLAPYRVHMPNEVPQL